MTTAAEIVDGLTGSECRIALLAFAQAVERAQQHGDMRRFVKDMAAAADIAERLAHGEMVDEPLPRTYVTSQMVLDIRSAPSAKAAAESLDIPASTARGIRAGRSHSHIGAAA